MKTNRSIPHSTIIPVLIYPDVRKAVNWLCETFGFKEHLQIGKDHRSQLILEDGAVIIGDTSNNRAASEQGIVTHQTMVRIENAKTHCEHARKHGALIVQEPTDFPYGERQYEAKDLAGHHWIFSETIHDIDPAEWGGVLKHTANR